MQICSRCVLPSTFPGIKFDENGVCQFCLHLKPADETAELKRRYHKKFEELLATAHPNGAYNVVMAYSGGKDSSYTLKVLKEKFGLTVLAITFNNGFISERALKNIHEVVTALGVDHVMMSPNFNLLSRLFKNSLNSNLYPLKALERASAICNSCMNMVKSYILKTAIEMQVPFIAYGWSPGQAPIQSSVMRLNGAMLERTHDMSITILEKIAGESLEMFQLQDHHFGQIADTQFYNIHPLAFLEYDEGKILKAIRELGWEDPQDTDANSTNCLLNGFANQAHLQRLGFHPYAFEIAGLVRTGHLTRTEGLEKLSVPPDAQVIDYVKRKLNIQE